MPRLSLAAALALALPLLAPAAPPALTADAVKEQLTRYKAERAEAEKTFTKEELASADEQAGKAEAALAAGNLEGAARLVTEARWQVPVKTVGLPENVVRVLGAGRLRHGDRVNAVAYSPDGRLLASGSKDGTVRVWDVGNGREVAVYRGHEGAKVVEADTTKKPAIEAVNLARVAGVSFSADGKRVASAGSDEIHIWDVAAPAKATTILKGHKGDVKCVAFAPTSPDLLLSGGADKRFLLWDVTKPNTPAHAMDEQAGAVDAVAWSPDEKFVGMADSSGAGVVFKVGKWDLPAFGGSVSDGSGAQAGVNALAFVKDGSLFAVGGNWGTVKVIGGPGGPEAAVGGVTKKVGTQAHSGPIRGVAASPDGKLVVSIGENDRTVFVWDVVTGRQVRAHAADRFNLKGACLAVRPDGRQIAAGYDSGQVALYPLSDSDDHKAYSESKDKLMAAAYSPDGKSFATGGGDAVVRVYDVATGAVKAELKGHKIAVTAVAWVNNASVASAGADKLVKVWDVAAGTGKDGVGHTVAVLALATDPLGKVLVSGGADKTVRGWNPATGEPTTWKYETTSTVCAAAVSADGKRVAVGCANGKLVLLAAKDDALAFVGEVGAHTAGVACVAFHPNGEKVATCGGDGAVKVWNAPESGSPTQAAPLEFKLPFTMDKSSPPMPVTSVGYSPDGKQIVSGGSEGVVRVWDTVGGVEARGLRGHTGWVTSVQFAPDGRSVLSCGIDATARIFDLPRSAEAAAAGHALAVGSVAVSRDGKYAATGSKDATVKVWDLASGREVATLTGQEFTDGGDGITAVVFVGADKVAAGGSDKKVRTWTFKPAKLVKEVDPKIQAIALAADPDGKTVAVASVDVNQTRGTSETTFDLYPGDDKPVNSKVTSKGKDDVTTAAAVSPDAKWGVLGGKDGVIQIWDLQKKERVGGDWPLLGKGAAVADMGLTPDSKTVVVIDDAGEVKVGDTAKRTVTASVKAIKKDVEVRGVVVAPTADVFATLGGDGEVKAWDMTCQEVRTWKLPFVPTCAVFTTDGKRIITGNQDGTAVVLELKK